MLLNTKLVPLEADELQPYWYTYVAVQPNEDDTDGAFYVGKGTGPRVNIETVPRRFHGDFLPDRIGLFVTRFHIEDVDRNLRSLPPDRLIRSVEAFVCGRLHKYEANMISDLANVSGDFTTQHKPTTGMKHFAKLTLVMANDLAEQVRSAYSDGHWTTSFMDKLMEDCV